eukprot:scaffold4392_cov63-Cyclotella_meneghiniana.AAC.17
MIVLVILFVFLSIPSSGGFTCQVSASTRSQFARSGAHSSPHQNGKEHNILNRNLLRSSASDDDTTSVYETFMDETDETLLRINFSFEHASEEKNALDAVRQYTKSFPFAAVLPVQPLTYLPVQMPDGEMALKVTFLRKKTEEKDSKDGGMLFQCRIASNDITNEDDELKINLVAKRVSKGQTVSKIFSEKQIILAFVEGLDEERGKIILDNANVQVGSVFHQWLL